MVKVSIRVRNGAACFRVAVQAESVEQAVSLVGGRYPVSDVRVRSLTNLGGVSADDRNARGKDSWFRVDRHDGGVRGVGSEMSVGVWHEVDALMADLTIHRRTMMGASPSRSGGSR